MAHLKKYFPLTSKWHHLKTVWHICGAHMAHTRGAHMLQGMWRTHATYMPHTAHMQHTAKPRGDTHHRMSCYA